MSKSNFENILIKLGITGFLIFIILFPIIFYYSTSFEKDITIKEKYISQAGKYGNTPIYYVVANDDTTYQIVNMWWKFDFNTIDDYGKLNIGKTYRVKGYGKRIPFLNMVHNIYDISV
jgi:hypothetical protein